MASVKDLTVEQWRHDPQFSYDHSIPREFEAVLVGWLGARVNSAGDVPEGFISKLAWAYEKRTIDQGWLGIHECEICHNHFDRGEILVVAGKKNYVSPKMILHYVTEHSYRPPEEYIEAVLKINVP